MKRSSSKNWYSTVWHVVPNRKWWLSQEKHEFKSLLISKNISKDSGNIWDLNQLIQKSLIDFLQIWIQINLSDNFSLRNTQNSVSKLSNAR